MILKDEFDRLAAAHKNFKVYYTVDKLNKPWSRLFWTGGIGHSECHPSQPAGGPPLTLLCSA